MAVQVGPRRQRTESGTPLGWPLQVRQLAQSPLVELSARVARWVQVPVKESQRESKAVVKMKKSLGCRQAVTEGDFREPEMAVRREIERLRLRDLPRNAESVWEPCAAGD